MLKSQQSGRSMVEMLGVLAIIGVLSVAGIAGYTMAMRKIKVNDILSAATTCSILVRTAAEEGGDVTKANCTTFGLEAESIPSGVTIEGEYSSSSGQVTVTVTAENPTQCHSVASGVEGTVQTMCDTSSKVEIITEI